MRNFENTLKALVLTIIIFAAIALFFPATREIIFAMWSIFWIPFQAFFLEDIVWKSLILLAILVIGGALTLTQREQRKLWAIGTGILEVVSAIIMFMK